MRFCQRLNSQNKDNFYMATPDSRILPLMIDAAKKAGDLIRQNFRNTDSFAEKTSHNDIVTQTDLDSQNIIHETIMSGMVALGFDANEIGFVQEESNDDVVKKHTFIVDPIDGTSNFSSGIPICGVSIGYAQDKELLAGVIFEPFSQTIWAAEQGAGAWTESALKGKRALPHLTPKEAKRWMVGAHFNSTEIANEQFVAYQKLYPNVRGMRNIGSLAVDLAYVTDGILDVICNRGCYFWDLAAGSVILNELGGQIFDLTGSPLQFDWENTKKKYEIIVCHKDLISQVQTLTT